MKQRRRGRRGEVKVEPDVGDSRNGRRGASRLSRGQKSRGHAVGLWRAGGHGEEVGGPARQRRAGAKHHVVARTVMGTGKALHWSERGRSRNGRCRSRAGTGRHELRCR
jgi:hypothetical protein